MTKTIPGDVSASSAIRALAFELAKTANKDEVLNGLVVNGLDAGEEIKRVPLHVMIQLEKDYGTDLSRFPVPGSERVTGSNQPYDKYKETYVNAKKETSTRPASFYKDFARATTEGQEIVTGLAQLEAEADKMDSLDLQQQRKQLQQRETALIGLYRKSVGLHLKINELTEAFGDVVRVGYSKVKGEPSNSTVPMYIISIEDATKVKALSVSAFLSLNVVRATEKGGDFAAIIASGKVTGDGDDGEEFEVTTNNYDNTTAAYANFLDDVDNVKAVYGMLNTKDKDGHYTNDDMLMSMARIAEEFTAIVNKPAMAARIKAVKEAEAKAAA